MSIELPPPDASVLRRKSAIIEALSKALPREDVIHGASETLAYECDALTAYRSRPLAVVLPRSTEACATAMKVCNELGVAVVPRGAGTSLVGGSLATPDSVILGTSRLNRILEVDGDNRIVRVEAGVTNLSVSEAVEAEGYFYAPDPSSQIACAISGNIAMNSGGPHCLKYGVTSNNLLGVKMVLVDSEVVELGGSAMDASGLDLLGLVCGSEGQLGLITEATLRLVPKPEGARPLLIGFESAEVAGVCVKNIISSGILPVAIEYMDALSVRLIEDYCNAGYPMCEALLIVEVEGSATEIEDQIEKVTEIAKTLNPVTLRVSQSEEESAAIWKGRKSAFGAMGQLGDFMSLDGTVPIPELPEALKRIGELSRKYGMEVANVFHAGDGNMHPLIPFNANKPGDLENAEALGAEILRSCVDVGGCLSGEHGVGIEKRDLMPYAFSADELDCQMRVKDVFDPAWRLNPAKVFPLSLSAERRNGHCL